MGINYDVLRSRLNKTLVDEGIHLTVADRITDTNLMLIEDTIWDGADRWAFKAFRDNWINKQEWKNQDELATSITTHILTYWNEKIT